MGFNARDLRKEALTQGASTGDASLAGIPGTGTLQVWRGQKEDVIAIIGTCRLHEDAGGLDKVSEALSEQRPIAYDGPLVDPAEVRKDSISTKVMVSSINRYRLPAERGGSNGNDATTYCLVNFVPAEPEQVAT